jgi:hypothetical protein
MRWILLQTASGEADAAHDGLQIGFHPGHLGRTNLLDAGARPVGRFRDRVDPAAAGGLPLLSASHLGT